MPQAFVARTGPVEEGGAIFRFLLQCRAEQVFDMQPPFGRHFALPPPISRRSHALARTAAPPRVIDKDAAYQRRGDGKEVGAVLPQYLLLIDKPEVCLVNQVRGLESLVGALTAQVAASLTTQFLIYHWNQPVQRLPVPVAPFDEHLRDISWRRLRHKTASREYVPVAFKSI